MGRRARLLDSETTTQIISIYSSGVSIKSIMRQFKLSEKRIRKILIDNNIPIRGVGPPKGRKSRVDFFLERINKNGPNGCWLWLGIKNELGYGRFKYVNSDGKRIRGFAHRFSYEHFIGPFPTHLCICHHCDNPGCVNPAHLFAGTPSDNIQDMISKGRCYRPYGEKVGTSKLTNRQVIEIREKLKQPYNGYIKIIAREYGVSPLAIYRIKHGITWSKIGRNVEQENIND